MRIRTIKSLTTFLLLVLCGLMPAFAQDDGYSTVYLTCYEKFCLPDYNIILEVNDNDVLYMDEGKSYITIKTNMDKIKFRVWNVPNNFSYESLKEKDNNQTKERRKVPVYEYRLTPNTNKYLMLFVGNILQVDTRENFERKKNKNKINFFKEYVLDDNSQQPIQQQYYQPVQELVVQQPIQQVPVAESNDFKSDVDVNIPATGKKSSETFVLIIANEDYQYIDKVKYAARDGEIFKEYCIKTLGVPEKQVRYCPNASFGVINGGVDWLRYALENFEGSRGIVYYCGHGIPDEHTGDAYIIPVDGNGKNTTTCYSLNKLYKTLAATNATNITYFMDACFTGANKEGSMLVAARGVAREPKKETLEGKSVVFSASSGDETAMTNEEQHHGLFTYYLLKKIQDTKGDVSYEELAAYISKNVKKDAFLLNEKPQNPVVATSPDAQDSWKTMNLK